MEHRFMRVEQAVELQNSTHNATELAFWAQKLITPLAPFRGSGPDSRICSRRRPWRR